MVLAVTQSQAIINLTSFQSISINTTEDGKVYILVDNNIVLGQYTWEEALDIIPWIADEIGKKSSTDNIVFAMPMSDVLLPKEEQANDNNGET
jgi:hypothetical protein